MSQPYLGNQGLIKASSHEEMTLLEGYAKATGLGAVVPIAERVGVTRQTLARAFNGEGCSKPLSEQIEEKTGLPAEQVCFLHRSTSWHFDIDEEGYAQLLNEEQWTELRPKIAKTSSGEVA